MFGLRRTGTALPALHCDMCGVLHELINFCCVLLLCCLATNVKVMSRFASTATKAAYDPVFQSYHLGR